MTVDADERPVSETVRAVLTDHSVTVGYRFGSHARGDAYLDVGSDIDVVVAFEDCEPGDPGHEDRHLALGVDLALAFGTDETVDRLREQLLADVDDSRSPADRFDDVRIEMVP